MASGDGSVWASPDEREAALWVDQHHIWHPFTQMEEWASEAPLVVVRGNGQYLYDDADRPYLDLVSSLWATLHGHNHPVMNAAIERQLHRVAHSTFLGATHDVGIKFVQDLLGVLDPKLDRVFFSDNGSTAVEVALKQSFQYWQLKGETKKTRFIRMEGAYHGDTLGAVGVGGR